MNKEFQVGDLLYISTGDNQASVYRAVNKNNNNQEIPQPRFSFETYDEDFLELLQIAGVSLDNYLKSLPLKCPEDWAWLQIAPPEIAFQHLCVSYKQYMLCIIVGLYQEDENGNGRGYYPEQMHMNLLRECETHGMTPCLFLIDTQTGDPVLPPCYLVDARSYEPIQLDDLKEDNKGLMSEWEINNLGVSCVCNYLAQNGCSEIAYCDVVGITPQIWFKKDGEHCYAYVRAIPQGLMANAYVINKNTLERYHENKGYFVNLEFCNIVGNNGEFMDKQLYRRSPLVHSHINLMEIDKAIQTYDFIQLIDTPSFAVN